MLDKIKEILSKQLRVDVSTLSNDTNIVEDIGADSLDVVEMLMSIEQSFNITVPDEDVPLLKTIGDVAHYVEQKT